MRIVVVIFMLAVVAPRIGVSDETFRCGNWLVSADISVAELLRKCGKPSSQEVSSEDVLNAYGVKVGTSKTEVWRYDRGSRAAAMIVTIVDGQIRSMERGK